ncbi:MAG: hypothetical protein EXR70_23395 [Deltaproteobacteria bacterium]|nr:hypothetical protein [Deltaproteobacteria bacterium]
MKWVTRKSIRVNRVATAWLIRRFIDPQAEFIFVEPDQVAQVQIQQAAKGFDAPGATYPHKDQKGRCSFETLVDEYCANNPVLQKIAGIVRGADFPEEINSTAESAGLQLISQGFPLAAKDDHDTVAKASFLYDALYAAIESRSK